jgi:2-polyprenyl-6-methoxyphenol hydroxylase-like FAD-dependent oxidoreductase
VQSGAPIIIAGGGIGGLATALGLARNGLKSIVLEQAPQFGEIGAGIQMAPNAFHCFDYLGIADRVRTSAVYVDELILMDAVAGDRIASIPLGDSFIERFGNPYAVVHRADLHRSLLEACQASHLVSLEVSARVESYEHHEDGVFAILSNTERLFGRALIGADGLHSNIRKQLVGDGDPIVSGHTTYRSVIPTSSMPENLRWNAATLWAGPKCHIVHYPLQGWKVFNLVVTLHNDAKVPAAGVPVDKDEILGGFQHVCDNARQIIEHGTDWRYWVLCDREPVANWCDRNVTLLGDAAHPMLQYFAQGACMALEDAVCIAESIARHPDDVSLSLRDYAKQRNPRTTRVQVSSRLIGDYIYHPDGAKADARNQVLGTKSAEDFYDSLAWLYSRPFDLPAAAVPSIVEAGIVA